jgi:hypothetical protein
MLSTPIISLLGYGTDTVPIGNVKWWYRMFLPTLRHGTCGFFQMNTWKFIFYLLLSSTIITYQLSGGVPVPMSKSGYSNGKNLTQ